MKGVKIIRDKNFQLFIPKLKIVPFESFNSPKLPVMGISGSGKSTLLNLLAGMEFPTEGRILWVFPNGDKIEWFNKGLSWTQAKKLRRKYFGFAFQNNTLIPYLTVRDNLAYPLLLKGYSQKQAFQIVARKLSEFFLGDEKDKIRDFLKRYSFQLSGGQLQRVAVVQAMIHDPYVLFADEPTGSLDRGTRNVVMNVLYKWVAEVPGGRMLLWVTHHENDPVDARASHRLFVKSGTCRWHYVV